MRSESTKRHPELSQDRERARHVNGRVSSTEKTGMVVTAMHRYLQQQAFKVFIGYITALAYNYRKGRYDDRNEWASRLANEA
ncbi:MAG: sulfide:quinone reductase [Paramuribaculum sp.]|nr:sulfide:quinone reductase [Paramuribaculum sp.]